jgi:hypothetical protein
MMAQLFDQHWRWTDAGNFDARAVGRVARTLVRELALRGGYSRAEIFYMLMQEIDSELLRIAADKTQEIFVPPQGMDKDVHTEHCCIKHGCKYNDPACPVWLGYKAQSYVCESCSFHWDHDDDIEPQSNGKQTIPVVTKEEIAKRRLMPLELDRSAESE